MSNLSTGSAPLVDWDHTVAYGVSMSHCRIFGIALRDGGALAQEVADALMELTDPDTGIRPVERVLFADEICEGHGRATYPDVLAMLNTDYGATGKAGGDVVRMAVAGASGFHEPEGVLLAAGAGVVVGDHPQASIADVTPTLLAAHSLEPPSYMDGSVLPWVIGDSGARRSLQGAAEPAKVERLSAQDEELIETHLRDLGYVD